MEATRPRVSIGLPVYNGGRYLKEAIDSILMQTFEDFELIISDNASTDETEQICRAYADKDSRVKYYRNEKNLGPIENFNRVFHLARGEYFRWACYDDLVAPTCIAECVSVLDRDPEVILSYPRAYMIDEHSRPIDLPDEHFHVKTLHLTSEKPHERFEAYLKQYFPVGGKCNSLFGVIRRDVLAKTSLAVGYPGWDRNLLGELALYGKLYEIPERLFLRRDHPQNSVKAHPDAVQLSVWLNPANKGKMVLPRWRWLSEYVKAIRRAPLSPGEELRAYYALALRYVRYSHRQLTREAVDALRLILTRQIRKERKDVQVSVRKSV